MRGGRETRNTVGHLSGDYQQKVGADEIVVQGRLGWAKQQQMTPTKLMTLRGMILTGGRFSPNLVRRLLQKLLITGKAETPFSFSRRLHWRDGAWHVTDEVQAEDWSRVETARIGTDQTSIYVLMSRVFHRSHLAGWLDLTDRVRNLSAGSTLRVERTL